MSTNITASSPACPNTVVIGKSYPNAYTNISIPTTVPAINYGTWAVSAPSDMVEIGNATLRLDILLELFSSKIVDVFEVQEAIEKAIENGNISSSTLFQHLPFLVDAKIFTADTARKHIGLAALDE